MKFIIGGEDWVSFFERMSYDGAIGIFYNDTWHGVLAYIIFALVCLLAVIGLISIIRFFVTKPKKSKMSAEEKWIKTGKL